MIQQRILATKQSNVRTSLMLGIPALLLVIVSYSYSRPRTQTNVIQDRDLAINRQLAKDQIFDSGADSTTGASLVHYANFESP
jgi:hypothetical protein